jgi:2TM domain-containing protein
MENSKEYQSAKKRVEATMVFYTHFSVYAAVIVFLAIIIFMTSPGAVWFHWPMLGWGIAVAIHAAFIFVFPGQLAVTEQMIEREMGKSNANS